MGKNEKKEAYGWNRASNPSRKKMKLRMIIGRLQATMVDDTLAATIRTASSRKVGDIAIQVMAEGSYKVLRRMSAQVRLTITSSIQAKR